MIGRFWRTTSGNRDRMTPARVGLIILFLLVVLGIPNTGQAQIQDSFIDTIYVDTAFVAQGDFDFGDTIWVGLGVANTFAVGGMGYRLVLPDTSRLTPAFVVDTVTGSYPVVLRLVGRGLGFNKPAAVTSALIRHPDTANIITGLLVDFEGTASLPQGTGTILELAFIAKSGIQAGDTSLIRVRDDLTRPIEPRNNLSDVTGTLAVYPRLRDAPVLWGQSSGGGEPGNNPPAISLNPPSVSYTIKQGETVAFTVTATDPDTTNDEVTLGASLPAGATFLPSNPVIGTVTAAGDFDWTPNFSQEGTFNVLFNAQDDRGGSANLTVTIVVEKQDIDILFTSSADNNRAGQVGGIPGKVNVTLPIDVLASRPIYGVQFDLDGGAYTVDSIIPTSKLDNFTVWDNVGLNADTTRVITFSVTGDSMPLASSTTIMSVSLSVDTAAAPGRYPVTFLKARESITPDPDVGSVEMFVENGVIFVDALGDVNLDLSMDVADMVSLTGSILGRVTLTPRQFDVSDVNGDGSTNVIDLVAIINAVLGFDTLTVPTRPVFEGGEAELYLVYGGQAGDQAIYFVEGYMPTDVAGMELSFTYDYDKLEPYAPIRTGQAASLNVQSVRENGHMKIVAYYNADQGSAVPPGPGRYFVLPVKVKEPWADPHQPPLVLQDAVLSDPAAAKVRVKGIDEDPGVLPRAFELHQNFPNPFNPSTTIRFDIGTAAGENVVLDVFNVLGQHVRRLANAERSAGRYEVEWDGRDARGHPVATGLYLYRLQVGNEVETKKMLLLK